MNPGFQLDEAQFRHVRAVYLESAGSMIRQLDESVWRCDGPGLEQHLAAIIRLGHSLKGSSFQLGLGKIGITAEAMESRGAACLGCGRVTGEDREAMREGVRALEEMLRCLEQEKPLPDPRILCSRLRVVTP